MDLLKRGQRVTTVQGSICIQSFKSEDGKADDLLDRRIPSVAAQTACNGHVEYCSRSYSNVSIIGAHDSYGVDPGNSECQVAWMKCVCVGDVLMSLCCTTVAANQNYSVTTQLNNGIRLLQVRSHYPNIIV